VKDEPRSSPDGTGAMDGTRAAHGTRMFEEAASASHAVRAQLGEDAQAIASIGAEVRRLAPRAVVTCARGSSDHAATYAKYLIETRARVLTSSAAPSVSSVYGIAQDLRECLFIAISQSGRSPDLLASVAAARASGATILALCNSPDAPLVAAADLVIELRAGPEISVAATKSYLATLAALARFVAAWTNNAALTRDLETLPALMDASWALDWSPALGVLRNAAHLYVIGRGLGLGAPDDDDDLFFRVNVNMLSVDAERLEGALVGGAGIRGEGPDHVAVVHDFSADRLAAAGIADPAVRQNLLAARNSAVHEE